MLSQSKQHIIHMKEVTKMNNDKNFIAQNIRAQYTAKEITEIDELRALDAKVKRPANVFAYAFGSIAAIVMGSGMSLAMVWEMFVLGIAVGVVGIVLLSLAYPIYKHTVKKEREKIAPEILRLTDELMK